MFIQFLINKVLQLSFKGVKEKQQKLAQYICRHRRCQYAHLSIDKFKEEFPHAQFQRLRIKNCRQQTLDCILYNQKPSDTCIIYAHGLGSNKLQVIPNIRKAKIFAPYHFLFFDFSGSGRSQGKYTGYGLLEQYDIQAIVNFLENNQQYSNYILWGRSMGAVSIILSQQLLYNKKIKLLVVDSPYSSFQKIAIEMASRKTIFPQVITKPLLQSLKSTFAEKMPVNPFNINLQQRMSNILTPMLFIYSRSDLVVDFHHSESLIKKCSTKPFVLEINEDHNKQRNFRSIQKIIEHIQETIKANDRRIRRENSLSIQRKLTIVSAQKSYNKQYYSPSKFYQRKSNRKSIFTPRQNQITNHIRNISSNQEYYTEFTSCKKEEEGLETTKQFKKSQYFHFKQEYPPLHMNISTKLKRITSSPLHNEVITPKKKIALLRRNKLNFAQDIN